MAFIILMFLVSVPFAIILNAWVLTNLWTWFIVPLGVPAIGIAWAAGIVCISAYLTKEISASDKGKTGVEAIEVVIKHWIIMFAKPITALIVGWIFHSFMY